MPLLLEGGLRLFRFESLPSNDVVHGIFTRHGGVSPAPWDTLNLGSGVGDDLERVQLNRRRALESLRRSSESVFEVWQVHSAEVALGREPLLGEPPQQADAILTNNPAVTLMMRFADCVPILLFDPVRGAVGMAHAGWLGTVRKVASAAVRAMGEHFQTRPADLWAGLGPSIAAHHYPVGPEVAAEVRQAFGPGAEAHLAPSPAGVLFDLWSANAALLESEGVSQIEVSGVCTACETQDWFSHRAEGGKTGRFGALIGLEG